MILICSDPHLAERPGGIDQLAADCTDTNHRGMVGKGKGHADPAECLNNVVGDSPFESP